MGAIVVRNLGRPDQVIEIPHGRMEATGTGHSVLWRSTLRAGWSWDVDLKPMAEGAQSCPMTHHEYVVSGSIRYRMDDGSEVTARAGDHLFIPPGHRGWVDGPDDCVLLDWEVFEEA